MKAHRAGRAEKQQRRGKDFQQAEAMEIQMRLLIEFILDQKENPPRRHGGTEKKPKKLTTRSKNRFSCACAGRRPWMTKDTKEHKGKINQTLF
jgi:hypothetical protein